MCDLFLCKAGKKSFHICLPQQWRSHWDGKGGHPDSEKIAKNREKSGKIQEKEEKSGRKGKNREVSFTLPLLTDRAGYATDHNPSKSYIIIIWNYNTWVEIYQSILLLLLLLFSFFFSFLFSWPSNLHILLNQRPKWYKRPKNTICENLYEFMHLIEFSKYKSYNIFLSSVICHLHQTKKNP